MSSYTASIPAAVFARLPEVLANHPADDPERAAFDVRIQAFPGDDGEQQFAIDVYSTPDFITPTDRRQNSYTQATQTTYYFTADGGFDGHPTISTSRI